MAKNLAERIDQFDPCAEGREWLAKQRTPLQAWRNCKRPDWMLWLIGRSNKMEAERKTIVRCTCEVARTVLHLIPPGERRPLDAITLAERWAEGEAITIAELSAAWAAASAAEWAAASDVARAAEWAAASAASHAASAAEWAAASDVARAVSDAARAAASDAAQAAASDAARAAAWAASLKASADIVRRHFPRPPKV